MKAVKLPERSSSTMQKHVAARNALVAKYTLETLDQNQKKKIDEHIVEMLTQFGLSASRAKKYRSQLRETQYYGMAALAMAFLSIPPGLRGILLCDQWEQVRNPLVALTNAEVEIENISSEIRRKHGVFIVLSDKDKQAFKWEGVISEASMPGTLDIKGALMQPQSEKSLRSLFVCLATRFRAASAEREGQST